MSYQEMVDTGALCCNAASIPIIGDGDTGAQAVLIMIINLLMPVN
jgi:hypothetical protein